MPILGYSRGGKLLMILAILAISFLVFALLLFVYALADTSARASDLADELRDEWFRNFEGIR